MSVYEETGAGYLTRTKDLNLLGRIAAVLDDRFGNYSLPSLAYHILLS